MLSFAEKYSILLINIVATVILARLLTPAETGLYSVAAGIINIAQTLRDFGVGNYIIQESELTRRRISTALGISVILGFSIAALFVFSAGPMASAFHEPRLKTVILIMSLNFILVAFASIGTARLHRDMNFRAALHIGIASALVHAATSILMASQGYGAIGMAWASVMGIIVYVVGNYICYVEDILLLPRLGEWRRVLSFGVLASGGYVLQEIGQRASDVVVGRFLGFGAAGLFSRASGLITLFQQALMNAVAPVAVSALARINRDNEVLQTPFLRFMSYTTLVAWPLLGIMALLALPIILVAFGPQWLMAVGSAQILCLAAGVAVLSRVAITLFTATGEARRLLTVQLVGVPILIGAISLGASISIEAAAAGTVVGSVAHALYSLHQINRSIATSWRQICGTLGFSMLVTVASLALPAGVIFFYGLSPSHFWPQTLAAGFGGVCCWTACIFVFRHPLRSEILLGVHHGRLALKAAWLFPVCLCVIPGGLWIWSGSARAQTPVHECAPGSITCVAITGTAAETQHDVPITFGQPFVAGDVPRGVSLIATDGEGGAFPVQMDQISSSPDRSVRFAILSLSIPELKTHQTILLSLHRRDETAQTGAVSVAALLATGYDLKVDIALRTPQITQITFGDREGTKPGIPFQQGEIVSVRIGDDPADRYAITISRDMAGGDFAPLTKIARAMMDAINKGTHFRAYKIGEGGGFEKLWVTTRDTSGQPFAVTFDYTGSARIASRALQDWAPPRRYSAAAGALLAKAGAAPETWLNGPVATEFSIVSPLVDVDSGARHPQLTVRFDVRFYAGGQRARTDVVLENDWTYEKALGNLSYDVAITQKGSVSYEAHDAGLYQHGRWHKVVWSGPEPAAAVGYDVPYFLKSRMVWNYDSGIHIADTVLADESRRLAAADTGPMGPAFVDQYMPTTGGREDIAPLPRWTALYLLSQDPRARQAMLANADASGGIPIHYRDRVTGQPVSLDRHPGIAMLFGKARGDDALPAVANGDTPWTPDAAHQPSLAYVPYLVTGDRFYLDEILYWANWDMGGVDPGYREGAKGLIHMNQIRGQAWSLRTLGEAAMALPDQHPMKAYFTQKLQNNLQWYADTYPRNESLDQVSPLGWVERPDAPGSTAPWQDDFLALVVGHLAEAGYFSAEEFFRWQAQSTVGRWTHQAEGYCWTMAPGYYIDVRTKSGQEIRDWGTLFHENAPHLGTCPARFPDYSYPESPSGYVAVAEAMLALSSDFNIPGASDAYRKLRRETSALIGGQSEDPSWAIVPRGISSEKRANNP
jgi:O-antigen/teichoic acid export membrane protein